MEKSNIQISHTPVKPRAPRKRKQDRASVNDPAVTHVDDVLRPAKRLKPACEKAQPATQIIPSSAEIKDDDLLEAVSVDDKHGKLHFRVDAATTDSRHGAIDQHRVNGETEGGLMVHGGALGDEGGPSDGGLSQHLFEDFDEGESLYGDLDILNSVIDFPSDDDALSDVDPFCKPVNERFRFDTKDGDTIDAGHFGAAEVEPGSTREAHVQPPQLRGQKTLGPSLLEQNNQEVMAVTTSSTLCRTSWDTEDHFLSSDEDDDIRTAPQYKAGKESGATLVAVKAADEIELEAEISKAGNSREKGRVSANPYNSSRTTPLVRPPFPSRTPDRSPIHGLSSATILRTCFRVGEAFNSGCHATRVGGEVIIEIFARVVASHRDDGPPPEQISNLTWKGRQHFVLHDIFHDQPPHVNAVYEGWKGVGLWEDDCAAFLEEVEGGRLCRCVGRMRREERKWVLRLMSIWEAGWEDVMFAFGAVCG